MTSTSLNSWEAVRAELMRRITERVWRPGERIPGEAELADEFGCARATVNRAMRDLAEAGLVERRRRAGTRVRLDPVRKATISIPIIRLEVERRGQAYRHKLLERKLEPPTAVVASRLDLDRATKLLHVTSLHLADSRPLIYEDRWINPAAVSDVLDEPFDKSSPNEWLVRNTPFTHGEIAFSAENARAGESEQLGVEAGSALFIIERTTWTGATPITTARLACAPGYRLLSEI